MQTYGYKTFVMAANYTVRSSKEKLLLGYFFSLSIKRNYRKHLSPTKLDLRKRKEICLFFISHKYQLPCTVLKVQLYVSPDKNTTKPGLSSVLHCCG